MTNGVEPYETVRVNSLAIFIHLTAGNRPEQPAECPDDVYTQVMRPCWKTDAADRPSFEHICAHLGKNETKEIEQRCDPLYLGPSSSDDKHIAYLCSFA
jgi:hypothetical protein